MNSKLLHFSMILSVILSAPNYLNAQAKSLLDYKIIKKTLSSEESSALNSPRQSPSNAYRLEQEMNGFSIIDNKTGFKHIPDSSGIIQFIDWSKNEDRILFNISHIPVGNGKYTVGAGVYFFKDKRTKIFRSDKYLLMNFRLSPDGKMIVATGSTSDKGYIIVIDVDTGTLTIVNNITSSDPAWTKDSENVIYVEFVKKGFQRLESANLRTGEKFEIFSSAWAIRSSISPDGNKIAFTSPDSESPGLRALYVIDIDGSGLKKIATIDIGGHFYPRWSSNSNIIAYERPVIAGHHGRTISSEIYLYDISTNREVQLTNNPGVLHKIRIWNKNNSIIIMSELNGKKTYQSYKLEK